MLLLLLGIFVLYDDMQVFFSVAISGSSHSVGAFRHKLCAWLTSEAGHHLDCVCGWASWHAQCRSALKSVQFIIILVTWKQIMYLWILSLDQAFAKKIFTSLDWEKQSNNLLEINLICNLQKQAHQIFVASLSPHICSILFCTIQRVWHTSWTSYLEVLCMQELTLINTDIPLVSELLSITTRCGNVMYSIC